MKNANIRIAGFTLFVIIGAVGLGFIPSCQIFGMEAERVDILSQLRPAESDPMEAAIEDFTANFDLLEQELAVAEAQIIEVDTIAEPIPVRYEWIVSEVEERTAQRLYSEDIRPTHQNIIDFEDFEQVVPVALMLIAMPISGSIGHAIGIGLISFTVINICTGKVSRHYILTYILALIFLVKFFLVA